MSACSRSPRRCCAAGYYLIVNSMRHGEVSVVTPFRYSGMLVALLTGFFVWGDIPSALAWGGIALLFASGIYLLHEDRRRRADDLPVLDRGTGSDTVDRNASEAHAATHCLHLYRVPLTR
jgi:hypothetical protein